MSWLEIRAKKRRRFEAEESVRNAEKTRHEELTMWERIEKCKADWTVKEILHMLAEEKS